MAPHSDCLDFSEVHQYATYHSEPRDPAKTHAYLVGGGIASLAAAVHLIQDANVPASQIHILESSPIPGGSMDGSGNPESGYIVRGGRMLNFSYLCLYDLLSCVPSLTDPKRTVMQEINAFNETPGNQTHANSRILSKGDKGPEVVDVKRFGMDPREKADLLKMMVATEKFLGPKKIEDCFDPAFFHTNFWLLWCTMARTLRLDSRKSFANIHSSLRFNRGTVQLSSGDISTGLSMSSRDSEIFRV